MDRSQTIIGVLIVALVALLAYIAGASNTEEYVEPSAVVEPAPAPDTAQDMNMVVSDNALDAAPVETLSESRRKSQELNDRYAARISRYLVGTWAPDSPDCANEWTEEYTDNGLLIGFYEEGYFLVDGMVISITIVKTKDDLGDNFKDVNITTEYNFQELTNDKMVLTKVGSGKSETWYRCPVLND